MRRNVFGTTPESTSPTIVSLNDQKISATHSLADLNLCATIQKKSKVYCVLFFKLTCRIIYARLYSWVREVSVEQLDFSRFPGEPADHVITRLGDIQEVFVAPEAGPCINIRNKCGQFVRIRGDFVN